MQGIFPQESYFVGMDALQESDQCIQHAGPNAEGMLATVSVLEMEYHSAVSKVADEYRRAYANSSPIDPYAFAAYDCTLILIDAITQAVNENSQAFPTRAQIVGVLEHAQLHGAIRTYSFDRYGDARSPLMALYRVKGGKWIYVGQIDASAPPG